MLKTLLTTGAVLFLGVATASAQAPGATTQPGQQPAAQQMSQAECEALWTRAAGADAASLSQTQAEPFVTNFSQADTTGDGQLSRDEFMTACQQGLVQDTATTGPGTGTGTGPGGAAPGATPGTGTGTR